MLEKLQNLFLNNRLWAEQRIAEDPTFFSRLVGQQTPKYLWIGCADSRVPANEIVGLEPGELFVHRNVANVVVHSDLNCLSVLQYAVEVLQVEHVIVTGHYGCGGVRAALLDQKHGLIDNWLSHVQDVKHNHAKCLEGLSDEKARVDLLCELNVIEQALNVGRTSIVSGAWDRGQNLTIHGFVYSLADGLIRHMGIEASSQAELKQGYQAAILARQPQISQINT